MLFRETVAVYCENHMERMNALCGQNAECWYVNTCGKYNNHWALEGWYISKSVISLRFITKFGMGWTLSLVLYKL
jgi:hypothetical protein